MDKSSDKDGLIYLIYYVKENLSELEDVTSHDENRFAYGEKTAYVEILGLLKDNLKKAEEYGLDFDIEEKFPL